MPPRGCYRSSAPSPASLGAGGEGMQGALSPGSQIPGPARCSEPTLGASVQYLLCTDPEKLSPSPLAFMASDLRCRSWGPPGRPTWSKDFALAFYPPRTPPSTLPVCSQLCEAGTDVQIAPLPLPRGRWPVCPVPRLCSPGKQGGYLKPQRPVSTTPPQALWGLCGHPAPLRLALRSPWNPHSAA